MPTSKPPTTRQGKKKHRVKGVGGFSEIAPPGVSGRKIAPRFSFANSLAISDLFAAVQKIENDMREIHWRLDVGETWKAVLKAKRLLKRKKMRAHRRVETESKGRTATTRPSRRNPVKPSRS
jgi:hypothetical protein